jgi:hypothetical protein
MTGIAQYWRYVCTLAWRETRGELCVHLSSDVKRVDPIQQVLQEHRGRQPR